TRNAQSLITTSLLKPGQTPDESRIRLARSAYFTRILGLPQPNLPQYPAWLASQPDHASPDPRLLPALHGTSPAADQGQQQQQQQQEDGADSSSSGRPAWQSAAPKADLYIDKAQRAQQEGDGSSGDGPAYPA